MANGAYRHEAFRRVAMVGIERQSWWLRSSADQLTHYVGMLGDRPEYETEAEAGMVKAEEALAKALEETRAAIVKFRETKIK